MQHLGGKSDHLTHRIPDKTRLWRKLQIHVQFTIKTAVFSFITWIQIISGLQLPAHLLLNPSYGPGLLCNGTLMPGHFCPSLDHYPVCSNHSRLLLRFRTPGFSCVNKPLMDNCSSRLRVRPTLRPPTRHSSQAELRSVTAACIRCKFSLMAEEFQLRLQTTEHTASWWTSTGPNTQGHMGAGVYPSSQSKSAWTDQDTQEKQLRLSRGRSRTWFSALQLQRFNLMQTVPHPRPWTQGHISDGEKVCVSSVWRDLRRRPVLRAHAAPSSRLPSALTSTDDSVAAMGKRSTCQVGAGGRSEGWRHTCPEIDSFLDGAILRLYWIHSFIRGHHRVRSVQRWAHEGADSQQERDDGGRDFSAFFSGKSLWLFRH